MRMILFQQMGHRKELQNISMSQSALRSSFCQLLFCRRLGALVLPPFSTSTVNLDALIIFTRTANIINASAVVTTRCHTFSSEVRSTLINTSQQRVQNVWYLDAYGGLLKSRDRRKDLICESSLLCPESLVLKRANPFFSAMYLFSVLKKSSFPHSVWYIPHPSLFLPRTCVMPVLE